MQRKQARSAHPKATRLAHLFDSASSTEMLSSSHSTKERPSRETGIATNGSMAASGIQGGSLTRLTLLLDSRGMSTVITNDEAKRRIGANVTRIMGERSVSQADLSRITEENEMTISRVVRGKHVPNSALLHRLSEALQVTTDELLAPIQSATPKKTRRTA